MRSVILYSLLVVSLSWFAVFDQFQHRTTGTKRKAPAVVSSSTGSTQPKEARFDRECNDGVLQSCHSLAFRYATRAEDVPKAITGYEKNCSKGFLQSCHNLGNIYLERKEYVAAKSYFRKNCEKGHGDSCVNEGRIEEFGGRFEEANTLFLKACSMGTALGCTNAANLQDLLLSRGRANTLLNVTCREPDSDECKSNKKALEEKCEGGVGAACVSLAWLSKEPDHALFQKGCEWGDGDGCFNAHDFKETASDAVFRKGACEKGSVAACLQAGLQDNFSEGFKHACARGSFIGCSLTRASSHEKIVALGIECSKGSNYFCAWQGNLLEGQHEYKAAEKAYAEGCKFGNRYACDGEKRLQKYKEPRPKNPPVRLSNSTKLTDWIILLIGKNAVYLASVLVTLLTVLLLRKRNRSRKERALIAPWWKQVYRDKPIGKVIFSHAVILYTIVSIFCSFRFQLYLDQTLRSYRGGSVNDLPPWVLVYPYLYSAWILLLAVGVFEQRRVWFTRLIFLVGVPLFLSFETLLIAPHLPMHISTSLVPLWNGLGFQFFSTIGFVMYLFPKKKTAVALGSLQTVPASTAPISVPVRLVTEPPAVQPVSQGAPVPNEQIEEPFSEPFEDRFEKLELLGEGVYAKVYRVKDRKTGREAAAKILSQHLKHDSISIERFRREIQITRYLNHPQILTMFDLIRENDALYLLMEFVPGLNLKDHIGTHSPLPIAQAIHILNQLLSVLRLCHSKNVIHRDLKPQNIMVLKEDAIKVLDFGIARMTSLSDLTQTGTSLGSPEYMAPELFSANVYDPRTDIYALGIILYEMLTGCLPYQGDSLPVLFQKHAQEEIPDVTKLRNDTPPWLTQILLRMLAKAPFNRYQCIDEIIDDVRSQRVLMAHLPRIAHRSCYQCNHTLPLDIPVCLYCGDDLGSLHASRDFDVYVSPTTDPAKLVPYIKKTFGETPPVDDANGLILTGAASGAAEVLKRSAHRQGVYLELRPAVKRHARAQWLATTFLLTALGTTTAAVILVADHMFSLSPLLYQLPWQIMVFGPVAAVLAPTAIKAYLARHSRPMVSQPQLSQETFLYPLLTRLASKLRKQKSQSMENYLGQVLEKYYQLRPCLVDLEQADFETLNRLVELSVEASECLTDLEKHLNHPDFFLQGEKFTRLEKHIDLERDELQKQRLKQQLTILHDELSEYFKLEEKYAGLVARLSQVQFFLSQLAGRLLVEKMPYSDNDRDQLEEALGHMSAVVDAIAELKPQFKEAA